MGVGFGGPPGGAPPPVSWWSRLRAWAGFDDGREPLAPPQPPVERPIGALGVALAGLEPATPSESLARNLAALVDQSV